MKKTAGFTGALMLALLLLGCGGPGPEREVAKEINEANEQLAESARKAEDLEAIQAALQRHDERKAKAVARLEGLSPERRKSAQALIAKETAKSREAMDQAFEDLPRRLKAGPNPQVLLETSQGLVRVELFARAAPETVKNFLRYVDEKFYDGTIFHRVIADFMIQGGGFEPGMKGEKKTHAPIRNEAINELSNQRGTLAMARTSDPNSATAQFFINTKDNPVLDRRAAQDGYGYAVFGQVVEGMDVVDKIRAVKTHTVGGHENVPVEDVVIKSARRVEKK